MFETGGEQATRERPRTDVVAVLDDRFRFEVRLGGTPLVSIWRAFDLRLNRTVVIRRAHQHVLTDRDALRRFRLESLATACLTHPHLAIQYDAIVREDLAYTVTEHVTGPDLAAVFAAGPLTPEELAAIGEQVASGLAAAHDLGVVHRGVQPRWLRLGVDGRVRLTDLSRARLPNERDRDGSEADAHPADDIRDLAATLSQARSWSAEEDHGTAAGRMVRRLVPDETSSAVDDLIELASVGHGADRPSAAQLTRRFRELSAGRGDALLRGALLRLQEQGLSW